MPGGKELTSVTGKELTSVTGSQRLARSQGPGAAGEAFLGQVELGQGFGRTSGV